MFRLVTVTIESGMTLMRSDLLWRLKQVGLDVAYYQITHAIGAGKLRKPRKNSAGHFEFTEDDYKAAEAHFRGKQ